MSESKEVVKLGLVAGRHPLPVDSYIVSEELTSELTQLLENGDYNGITHLVYRRMKALLESHIVVGYGHALNQRDYTDVMLYESDVKVELYITGLTSVALAALSWCAMNGVEVTAMNYDRESGQYLPQSL